MRSAHAALACAVVLSLIAPQITGQEQKRKKGEAADRAEALRKMGLARGDIQFGNKLLRQESFKKMCKPVTLDQLSQVKENATVAVVGKPIAREGDAWIIATKKGPSGWDRGPLRIVGDFKGAFVEGQLACVYGTMTRVHGEAAIKAYLVDKPTDADIGLVFQYKVLGQRAVVADQVQTWTVVGEVANTGVRDYAYVELEAIMESAGDDDVWFDFVRPLPAKTKKPFNIKLIGLQFSSVSVSTPKITVYIRDFSE
jgi:hypothetical protein